MKNLKYLSSIIFYNVISILSYIIPKNRHKIIFISSPDYSDNAKYIYDKMIEKKLNKKLNLIWLVNKPMNINHAIINSPLFFYYILTSKYIICTHGIPYWKSKNQTAILTEHGLPFKASGYISNISFRNRISLHFTSKKLNYILSSSRFHAILLMAIYRIPSNKILITGFPRQDGLVKKKDIDQLNFTPSIKKYNKIILYAPTFRDWKNDDMSNTILNNKIFLKFLKEKNWYLIYKPHKNVILNSISNINDKNVYILKDIELIQNKLHLYDIFSIFNIVITDYSSIFYESSYLNVPTLFYMPDFKEYNCKRGLLFNPKKWLPGMITTTVQQLIISLSLMNDRDNFQFKRNIIKNLMFDVKKNCTEKIIRVLLNDINRRR
jgi:CDP-glycerol glycerophosphotransferase (TagB/SpsB family)